MTPYQTCANGDIFRNDLEIDLSFLAHQFGKQQDTKYTPSHKKVQDITVRLAGEICRMHLKCTFDFYKVNRCEFQLAQNGLKH